MELFELLEAEDVDTFNLHRGERARLDFFAADLPGRALSSVDLSNANLDKSDLTGTDLSDANLVRASFTGVDGTGLKLCRAIAIKARFKEAFLDEADLSGADLSRADLTEANLARSSGEGVRLPGARLREVQAEEAVWVGADLTEANLHKARLLGADLRRANFDEAQAAEAVLDRANLEGISGTGAKFPAASMRDAVLVGARLVGANLSGANLSGADLSNADLTRANLTGSILTGARLRGAILVDACLDGVDLSGLDVSGVDFSGVDPGSLALTEAQRATVSAIGVAADTSGALHFDGIDAARNGDHTALLWDNADTEDSGTIRYAVLGGIRPIHGVLPVPADTVLARGVVALGDGFGIVVLRERTGGPVSVVHLLGKDGTIGRSITTPLGYDPAVRPVLRASGEGLVVWSIARRGPMLVVHRLTDAGLEPVQSQKQATAQHFLGRHDPVLACKGGVVLPLDEAGARKPLRTPEGFPGQQGLAVPVGEDRVCAVWVDKRVGSRAGGVRAAWLAARGTPEVEELSRLSGVTAMDALVLGDRVLVAWVDAGEDGLGAAAVHRVLLPGGDVETLPTGLRDVHELTIAPGPGGPRIVVSTLDEVCHVLDDDGSPSEYIRGSTGDEAAPAKRGRGRTPRS